MKLTTRTLALAAALTLTAGVAMAADAMKDCCCKDKDGKMSCCDEMKTKDGQQPQQPAPQHQH